MERSINSVSHRRWVWFVLFIAVASLPWVYAGMRRFRSHDDASSHAVSSKPSPTLKVRTAKVTSHEKTKTTRVAEPSQEIRRDTPPSLKRNAPEDRAQKTRNDTLAVFSAPRIRPLPRVYPSMPAQPNRPIRAAIPSAVALNDLPLPNINADLVPIAKKPETVNDPQEMASDQPAEDSDYERTIALERIARLADAQIREGFDLAGRGAYFAADKSFIEALRMVSQGLDTELKTDRHARALAAGLTALREADSFLPEGNLVEGNLNLKTIIEGHSTTILKDSQEQVGLTPLKAMTRYLTYGQEQLAAAVGKEVAGSMALHALGKLHEKLREDPRQTIRAAGAKAVAYYQAALLAVPANFLAGNDLAVLFAREGRDEDAIRLLEQLAPMHQEPTCLHNLAKLYERQGRAADAQRTRELAARLKASQVAKASKNTARQQASRGQQVQWVDAETFSQTNQDNYRTAVKQPSPAGYPGIQTFSAKSSPAVAAQRSLSGQANQTSSTYDRFGPRPATTDSSDKSKPVLPGRQMPLRW